MNRARLQSTQFIECQMHEICAEHTEFESCEIVKTDFSGSSLRAAKFLKTFTWGSKLHSCFVDDLEFELQEERPSILGWHFELKGMPKSLPSDYWCEVDPWTNIERRKRPRILMNNSFHRIINSVKQKEEEGEIFRLKSYFTYVVWRISN